MAMLVQRATNRYSRSVDSRSVASRTIDSRASYNGASSLSQEGETSTHARGEPDDLLRLVEFSCTI